MTHRVRNLKNDAEKRARHGRSSYGKGGWKSVLFRLDGTVDSNMSLSGWSRKERNEIYAEMVVIINILRMKLIYSVGFGVGQRKGRKRKTSLP